MTALAEISVALDPSALLGSWQNTNIASRGIPRIDVTAGAPLTIHVFAAGDHDWGTVSAPLFTDSIDSKEAMAFSAVYDLGYADVHLQANIKGGVLVVATFNRIKDDSGRSSYFMREFYYRA